MLSKLAQHCIRAKDSIKDTTRPGLNPRQNDYAFIGDFLTSTFVDSNRAYQKYAESLHDGSKDRSESVRSANLLRTLPGKLTYDTKWANGKEVRDLTDTFNKLRDVGIDPKTLINQRLYSHAEERITLHRKKFLEKAIDEAFTKAVKRRRSMAKRKRNPTPWTAEMEAGFTKRMMDYRESVLNAYSRTMHDATQADNLFQRTLHHLQGGTHNLGVNQDTISKFDRSVVGWELSKVQELRADTLHSIRSTHPDSPEQAEADLAELNNAWTIVSNESINDGLRGQLITEEDANNLRHYKMWMPFMYSEDDVVQSRGKELKKQIQDIVSGTASEDDIRGIVWGIPKEGTANGKDYASFRAIRLIPAKAPPLTGRMEALDKTVAFAIKTKMRADTNLTRIRVMKAMAEGMETFIPLSPAMEDILLTGQRPDGTPVKEATLERLRTAKQEAIENFDPNSPQTWANGLRTGGFIVLRFNKTRGSSNIVTGFSTVEGHSLMNLPPDSWLVKHGDMKFLVMADKAHPNFGFSSAVFRKSYSPDGTIAQAVIETIIYISSMMRKGMTTLSPEFIMDEFIRTSVSIPGFFTNVEEDLGYELDKQRLAKDYAANQLKTIKGYLRYAYHRGQSEAGEKIFEPRNEVEEEILELENEGGLRRIANLNTDIISSLMSEIEIAESGGKNTREAIVQVLADSLEFVESLVSVIDVSSSLSLAMGLKNQGVHIEDRANISRKYPVDFSQSGTFFRAGSGRMINNLYFFLKVSIIGISQGLSSLRNKSATSTVMSVVNSTGGQLLAAFFALQLVSLLLMDEDDEIEYLSLPQHTRTSKLVIPMGDDFITIPVPWFTNVSIPLANAFHSQLAGNFSDEAKGRSINEIAISLSKNFLLTADTDSEGVTSMFLPSLFLMYEEAEKNADYDPKMDLAITGPEKTMIFVENFADRLMAIGALKATSDTASLMKHLGMVATGDEKFEMQLRDIPILRKYYTMSGENQYNKALSLYRQDKKYKDRLGARGRRVFQDKAQAIQSMYLLASEVYEIPVATGLKDDQPALYRAIMEGDLSTLQSRMLSVTLSKEIEKSWAATLRDRDISKYLEVGPQKGNQAANDILTYWTKQRNTKTPGLKKKIESLLENHELTSNQRGFFEELMDEASSTAFHLPTIKASTTGFKKSLDSEVTFNVSYHSPKMRTVSSGWVNSYLRSDKKFSSVGMYDKSKRPIHEAIYRSNQAIYQGLKESKDFFNDVQQDATKMSHLNTIQEQFYNQLVNKSFKSQMLTASNDILLNEVATEGNK